MSWRIHSGPFPFVALANGQMWLWRITDGTHYTATTVQFTADSAEAASSSQRSPEVEAALTSRGRVAVERCLRWSEPPREITFRTSVGPPAYWGGRR